MLNIILLLLLDRKMALLYKLTWMRLFKNSKYNKIIKYLTQKNQSVVKFKTQKPLYQTNVVKFFNFKVIQTWTLRLFL